jgi:hypothetical protein
MNTRRRFRTLTLWAAVLAWCPSTAWAQTTSAFQEGDPDVGEQLIVTYVSDRFGPSAQRTLRTVRIEFLAVEGSRLMGRIEGGHLAIDTESIRRLKRRVGTKPASAPAMAMGSAAGFAAGFLLGALSHSERLDPGGQSAASRGLSAGVLLGAPLGALVAWVSSRSRPIYEDVGILRARPSVALSPSGRMRLSVSVQVP